MTGKRTRDLILILGDQLTESLDMIAEADSEKDCIVMMEVNEEATYVAHHCHKIILIFSAMRHFAKQLTDKGFCVHYIELDDSDNHHSLDGNIQHLVSTYRPESLKLTEPGEYRVLEIMQNWKKNLGIPVEIYDDNRFYCSIRQFKQWAHNKKQLRMEYFYRWMRQRTEILVNNGQPEGGQWNFDENNRQPADPDMDFPTPPSFKLDDITQMVKALVKKQFKQHIGQVDTFNLAVTHRSARYALTHFIKRALDQFGTYQDAMLLEEYTLFHSQLSAYMNIGLLTAREVVCAVIDAYHCHQLSLNSVEGFVRQILGWREYMRGMYWLYMPDYKSMNFLKHDTPLPTFYWTAKTDMRCLQHAIEQTIQTANSHHIQRLMITGNFALLIGVLPDAICEWYLAVYADAFEWVELPNTLGMSQFADGGKIASKPYISSGNYINKMSNFCKHCRYNVKAKLSEDACPFNVLYWHFLIKHEKKLRNNPRMGFAYRHIDKLPDKDKKTINQRAKAFIASLK